MSSTTTSILDLEAPPAFVEFAAPLTGAHARPTNLDADVTTALGNASKLGLSLIATWGVGLAVRIVLPRQLGPTLFGAYQFADSLTAGLFVLAGFGIETYVRRELATRPERSPEFYGGLLLLRVALGLTLLAGVVGVLAHAGRPLLVLQLVALLAAMQFFAVENATLSALLHAVGKVNGLSVLSVVSKIIWGGGSVLGLVLGGGMVSVGAAMLTSEAVQTVGLFVLARRHVGLRTRVDARATWAAIAAGVPFFVGGLSTTLAGRLNATIVAVMASDTELGWYGAASTITGVAMLLAPLFGWVLLPLTARAESRSSQELTTLVQRTMGLVLTVAVPITLLLTLGADVIVHVLFGAPFAPAVASMRALAPMFISTYIAMVSGSALIGVGRGWAVTTVSLCSLVVLPALTWLLVPRGLALIGPGGAGAGAALALNLSEVITAIALTRALGNRAFDRPRILMLAKMAVVCTAVVALDRVLASFGVVRLAADVLAYVVLSVAWKAGDYDVLLSLTRRISARRRQHAVTIV